MSDHNITPNGVRFVPSEPKKPWYKHPLTYAIGAPAIILAFIMNGVVGNQGTPPGADPVVIEETSAPAEESEPAAEPVEDEPEPEPTPEPVAEEAEEADVETLGLIVLRDQYPEMALIEDKVITDAAKAACELFDSGGTWDMYVLVAVDSGLTPEQAGAVAGFAVAAYCPEYEGIAG